MVKYLQVILLAICMFGCKEKKKSLSGGDKIGASDFFDAFPKLKLPYSVTDTTVNSSVDTTTISYPVFTQFAPDTIFTRLFPNEKNIVIHPIGIHELKGKENYLLVQARSKKKTAVYLLVFDKNRKFSASMPLVQNTTGKDETLTATIDNRLAISMNKEWKSDEELLYSRMIYAYNNVGMFTLVMTETNDQSGLSNKINNPLDTLPKQNKYSGDYTKGKNSIVSLRDGKDANSYLFFVHFENENSEEEPCNGEIKGELVLSTPTSAVFSDNDDPCVIDFTFTSSTVKVKEQSGCGSHRGIRCFFNDTYTKKKIAKPAATKKEKT